MNWQEKGRANPSWLMPEAPEGGWKKPVYQPLTWEERERLLMSDFRFKKGVLGKSPGKEETKKSKKGPRKARHNYRIPKP